MLGEWKEGVGDHKRFFHWRARKIVAEPMDKLTIFPGANPIFGWAVRLPGSPPQVKGGYGHPSPVCHKAR